MLGYRSLLVLAVSMGLLASGCGGSSDSNDGSSTPAANGERPSDAHKHVDPETFAQAVDVLKEMRDELAAGFKEANVEEVDHVIHEMGPLLMKAGELVASSDMDQYDQKDAEAALEQIMAAVGELHPSHGADAKVDPADYDEQADSLNSALETLEKLAASDGDESDS